MSVSLTFKDLYDFVLLNKGDRTFMGYNDIQIVAMLKKGIENNLLFYSVNSKGLIDGMILAIKDDKNKILFIDENLAMNMTNLKQFAKKGRLMFPDYKLEAIRHKSHRKFDTSKLWNKLTS